MSAVRYNHLGPSTRVSHEVLPLIVATVVFWGIFIPFVIKVSEYVNCTQDDVTCTTIGGELGITTFFFVVSFVVLQAISFSRPVYAFLRSLNDIHGWHAYVNQMIVSRPELVEHVHCYHTKTNTDSDGKSTTETVTTHEESVMFPYDDFVDRTDPASALVMSEGGLYRVYCDKVIEWETDHVRARYFNFQQTFRQRHMHCDSDRTFSSETRLSGYHSYFLACQSRDQVPFAIRHGCLVYMVASLCGLAVVYCFLPLSSHT